VVSGIRGILRLDAREFLELLLQIIGLDHAPGAAGIMALLNQTWWPSRTCPLLVTNARL